MNGNPYPGAGGRSCSHCRPAAAKKEGRAPAPVPVLAAVAATRPMADTMGAVGTVEPIESVAVRAQVTGVVTEIGFKEGQDVRAGQLLFQIDPRPLQAALAAAEAELARDRAEAENARVAGRALRAAGRAGLRDARNRPRTPARARWRSRRRCARTRRRWSRPA